MSDDELDACPVATSAPVDDDELPYAVLFASVLFAGMDAIADRAAEYRAIFHDVTESERQAFGRRFLEVVQGRW